MIDSGAKLPIIITIINTSSQSPRPNENDAVGTESHEENTKADDTEHETATVTGREQEATIVVASEVQAVEADDKDQRPRMIRQPDSRQISQTQLVSEVKTIYSGLTMVESKCIDVDNEQSMAVRRTILLDISRIICALLVKTLCLLQDNEMKPEKTVRDWFLEV
ncbi:hypothetical protein CONLIGDRAFT_278416 [Coniochaeta ligniaria NRRL 30616]|uniref:Uncharacterized protein n=1 Tax=Coniochaeta ligniaria NRRL 30616 TaxID=1408157 RepID=A0A1J7IXJ8_9PEZI|nr:hypothetical protein CONLIGDRAFT_278416 [Coniochaeta ligniaria NRRL 30616]